MVDDGLLGDGTVIELERGSRYLGKNPVPGTRQDIGLVVDMLANQCVVEVGNATINNQVGNGGHLDINQFDIVAVLLSRGVELDRLVPVVDNLVLVCHVVAVVHGGQFHGKGTVAAEGLDVGLALFRRVDDPVLSLRPLLVSDAVEEGCSSLFVNRSAGVDDMAVHRSTELELAA